MQQARLAHVEEDRAAADPFAVAGPTSHVHRSTPEREPSKAEHEEKVFSLVYRQMHALRGSSDPCFEDLVQAAAEQALRALPSFRGESELATFTYRICYRAVLRQRRWARRWLKRFTLASPDAEAVDGRSDAVTGLIEQERAARLHAALERLSDKRRAVVVMRDLEGLDTETVAKIVEASEATVRSRLRDARRQLAELLDEDPYFGSSACLEETP